VRLKREYLFILIGFIFCLTLAGCATYSFVNIKERIDTQEARGYHIEGLEFVRQRRNWCGPAALASVFHYWGEDISQEEIAKSIYLPNIKGTLTFDLENYALNKGYFAQALHPDIYDLGKKIRSGIPVIVMHQVLPVFRKYHYLVIFGYSDTDRAVLAYDGRERPQIISYANFLRKWEGAGNWTLVVCPPEKVSWQLDAYYSNRLGLLYEKKGKIESARGYYQEAFEQRSDNATYAYNIANTYLKEGKFDQAVSFYKKAIKINPDFAASYNNLAYSLGKLNKDLEKAKSYATRAIEIDPDNRAFYLDTLGVIYLKMNRTGEAISVLKEALASAKPSDKKTLAIICRHLAEAYKEDNNLTQYWLYIEKIEDLKSSN
jgi:tetratricopeptide (TPR) repeat protein